MDEFKFKGRIYNSLHLIPQKEENPRHFVPRIDNSLVYFWGSVEGEVCCPLKMFVISSEARYLLCLYRRGKSPPSTIIKGGTPFLTYPKAKLLFGGSIEGEVC
jgi:hypothetical protein